MRSQRDVASVLPPPRGAHPHVTLSANEAASAPEESGEPTWLGLTRAGWARLLVPTLIGILALGGWEWAVRVNEVPSYILPGPIEIGRTLARDWDTLSGSLVVTLQITFAALAAAAMLGLLLAVLFAQSRVIELSLFPYAVILQVTPVVAIAPLIIIWVDDIRIALLICAWIVAFFPILSNTTLGLNSADHNLVDLFRLYRARSWQVMWHLRLPTAMPFFLGGLRISGGLALIGAIVAEFVAGTGGRSSGLAYRILESGYQLQIPRMFAALVLVSATGIAIFLALSLVSHLALRHWHESAMRDPR
jgi:NitT/TauT family transport system permease protein